MRTSSQISGLFAAFLFCWQSLSGQGAVTVEDRYYRIDSLCHDETAIYHGFRYNQAGIFLDTFRTATGNDSIIVHVTIGATYDCDTVFPCNESDGSSFYIKPISKTLCEGETMVLSDQMIENPGLYEDTIFTGGGLCDTILLVDIDYASAAAQDTQVIEVLNGLEYQLNGVTFTSSDTISTYFSTNNTCDSTHTTILYFVDDLPPPTFYTPTIFSPNGDNINDQFFVRLKDNSAYDIGEMHIYSRWGDRLWSYAEGTNESWNGRHQNNVAAPGVYMVLIEFKRIDGKRLKVCRDVTVVL